MAPGRGPGRGRFSLAVRKSFGHLVNERRGMKSGWFVVQPVDGRAEYLSREEGRHRGLYQALVRGSIDEN